MTHSTILCNLTITIEHTVTATRLHSPVCLCLHDGTRQSSDLNWSVNCHCRNSACRYCKQRSFRCSRPFPVGACIFQLMSRRRHGAVRQVGLHESCCNGTVVTTTGRRAALARVAYWSETTRRWRRPAACHRNAIHQIRCVTERCSSTAAAAVAEAEEAASQRQRQRQWLQSQPYCRLYHRLTTPP